MNHRVGLVSGSTLAGRPSRAALPAISSGVSTPTFGSEMADDTVLLRTGGRILFAFTSESDNSGVEKGVEFDETTELSPASDFERLLPVLLMLGAWAASSSDTS